MRQAAQTDIQGKNIRAGDATRREMRPGLH